VLEAYKPSPHAHELSRAARVLLDTKQFMKDFAGNEAAAAAAVAAETAAAANAPKQKQQKKGEHRPPRVFAPLPDLRVEVSLDLEAKGPPRGGAAGGSGSSEGTHGNPPRELLTLPVHASLGDLKRAAEGAFGALYKALDGAKVTDGRGVVGATSDRTKLRAVLGAAAGARQRPYEEAVLCCAGGQLQSEWRYEGGLDQWVVACACGTTDDDGERMFACDACGIWFHTRCVGISDAAAVPDAYTCVACGGPEPGPDAMLPPAVAVKARNPKRKAYAATAQPPNKRPKT